jgi:hypothetical protein
VGRIPVQEESLREQGQVPVCDEENNNEGHWQGLVGLVMKHLDYQVIYQRNRPSDGGVSDLASFICGGSTNLGKSGWN